MRQHLEPTASHPITIKAKSEPVRVMLAGNILLASKTHLELREASYPAVAYIPRSEIDMGGLERSSHTTWCPYKGEASYFHIRKADGALWENVGWTYENPFPAVEAIRGALAVYPNKVDAIRLG